ncbi:MAG: VWA domain-containing protein [Rhodopirellula sp.]|nr:VWA domain-containing protein [Rhodopirellula sp.]
MNRTASRENGTRRGAIVVLFAVLMIVIFAMLAFAVDLGFVALTRTQLQVAADAAALAGAGTMVGGTEAAEAEVRRYIDLHQQQGSPVDESRTEIRFGNWDTQTRRFDPGAEEVNAIDVAVHSRARPFFFARVLGRDEFDSQARAIASFSPRDIMLVLDFSGSMCFDSQLSSIDTLGRVMVEENLQQIYSDLGSPRFGKMQWTPKSIPGNSTQQVKSALGLTKVPYPYPSGSWDNYISYVMTDSDINRAGYRRRYGYLTWINYLQAEQCRHAQTPDLWMTREQPVTAVKDSVDLLVAYLQENCPHDRLGLSIYTASDSTAILECEFTNDFAEVAEKTRHRQAGHYNIYTNIYDGMKTGRLEFERNGRSSAGKLMVLMTDGQANLPQNEKTAKRRALEEAHAAAAARIPIVTISLGAGADTDLMQQIADITKGVYFEIPGGQPVADYEEQLKDVFRRVASDRKLALVQ